MLLGFFFGIAVVLLNTTAEEPAGAHYKAVVLSRQQEMTEILGYLKDLDANRPERAKERMVKRLRGFVALSEDKELQEYYQSKGIPIDDDLLRDVKEYLEQMDEQPKED